MRKNGVESWSEVELVSKKVAWSDTLKAQTFESLWQMVQDFMDRKLERVLPFFSPTFYLGLRFAEDERD